MDPNDIMAFYSSDGDALLERVDEYTIYCHYLKPILGEDPVIRKAYQSPVRESGNRDGVPSFGLYYTTKYTDREFLWCDNATGQRGDIYKLLMYLYEGITTKSEAVRQIKSDFNLGPRTTNEPKIILNTRKEAHPAEIDVIGRAMRTDELDYMAQFNIDKKRLDRYQVQTPKLYWLTAFQRYPIYPKDMTFAFKVFNRYQIYRPLAPDKSNKFRNDWTDSCVLGAKQLQYKSDILDITKAYKDVMCLDSLGFDAIGPRGEHVMILDQYIQYLLTRYKHIITYMDNDGKTGAWKYRRFYGISSVCIPVSTGSKDPSDFTRDYKPKETISLTEYFHHEVRTQVPILREKYLGKSLTITVGKERKSIKVTQVCLNINPAGIVQCSISWGMEKEDEILIDIHNLNHVINGNT